MLINGKAYVEDSVNTLRIGNTMQLCKERWKKITNRSQWNAFSGKQYFYSTSIIKHIHLLREKYKKKTKSEYSITYIHRKLSKIKLISDQHTLCVHVLVIFTMVGIWIPTPDWLTGMILLQKVACNHQSLNFTCSFIDFCYPGITVVPFSWHVCYISHPSQNLDSL